MWWIIGILVVLWIIGTFSKGGGSSGGPPGGGGGGGHKIPLPVKMGVAGAAGYAIGKKMGKV